MAERFHGFVCELKNVRASFAVQVIEEKFLREAKATVLPSNGCMLHQSRNPLIKCKCAIGRYWCNYYRVYG